MSKSNIKHKTDTELKKGSIYVDPFYSDNNQRHLQKAIKQLEDGGGTEHEIIET